MYGNFCINHIRFTVSSSVGLQSVAVSIIRGQKQNPALIRRIICFIIGLKFINPLASLMFSTNT